MVRPLRRDDGADAEQLSRLALSSLAQASLRRSWPLVSGALPDEVQNGLARQINLVKPRATLYLTRRQPDPKDQIAIDASTL